MRPDTGDRCPQMSLRCPSDVPESGRGSPGEGGHLGDIWGTRYRTRYGTRYGTQLPFVGYMSPNATNALAFCPLMSHTTYMNHEDLHDAALTQHLEDTAALPIHPQGDSQADSLASNLTLCHTAGIGIHTLRTDTMNQHVADYWVYEYWMAPLTIDKLDRELAAIGYEYIQIDGDAYAALPISH